MRWDPRRGAQWALVSTAVLTGCSQGATAPLGQATVVVTPSKWLLSEGGAEVRFDVTVTDQNGDEVPSPEVEWEVTNPALAAVNGSGQVTALSQGVTQVVAGWSGVQGSAELEVYFPSEPDEYTSGTSYFGRLEYIEYVPGTLPIVISAPHGGALQPAEIPNRSWGVTVTDSQTKATIRAVREAFFAELGASPHIVISHLRRNKLDPNREIDEAAQGSPYAGLAWEEYHDFIERGKGSAQESAGWGLYLDLHGHGHSEQRLELGYLLSASSLAGDDSTLASLVAESSVSELAGRSAVSFPDFIRGGASLGSLLQDLGVRAVPSEAEPDPAGEPYFSGGYSTARHGSRDGGSVSAVQLELHWEGVRDSEASRRTFADQLVAAVDVFLEVHLGPSWSGGPVSE